MGGHRLESSDSRCHSDDPGNGTIPEQAVIGRVFLVVPPPAQFREVPIPATFAQRGLAAPPPPGPDAPADGGGTGLDDAACVGVPPADRTRSVRPALGSDQ
jgi:signal peptidase I